MLHKLATTQRLANRRTKTARMDGRLSNSGRMLARGTFRGHKRGVQDIRQYHEGERPKGRLYRSTIMRHDIILCLLMLCSCASSEKVTTEEMSAVTMATADLTKLTDAELDLDIDLLVIQPTQADTTRIVGKIAKKLQATEKAHTVQVAMDTTKTRHEERKESKTHHENTSKTREIIELFLFACIIIIFAVFLRRKAQRSTTL